MRTIFLGNIPRNTPTAEVEKLVGAFGPVARVDLKDRFAFVGMQTQSDADRVVKELHKTSFNGLTISAEFAKRDEGKHRTWLLSPYNKFCFPVFLCISLVIACVCYVNGSCYLHSMCTYTYILFLQCVFVCCHNRPSLFLS